MVLTKEQVEEILLSKFAFTRLREGYTGRGLTSTKIKLVERLLSCPGCGKPFRMFFLINGIWRCPPCHNFVYRPSWRNVTVEEVLSELQEFFGELTTERLLDREWILTFMEFFGYDSKVLKKTALFMILRALLQKEVSVLDLVLKEGLSDGGFREDSDSETDSQ